MRRLSQRFFFTAAFLSAALSFGAGGASNAWAQSASDDVRTALHQMHAWVGEDPNGQTWRTFLSSSALEAELAKGAAADAAVVAKIAGIYSGPTAGLDSPAFVAVRRALENWMVELARENPAALSQLAGSAKDRFVPPPASRLETARQELQSALASLDQFLQTGAAENRDAWRRHLRTDALEQLLARPASAVAEVEEILGQYSGPETGLELPQFTAVRSALRSYLNAVTATSDADLRKNHARTLDDLVKRLNSYDQKSGDDDALAIGRAIGWLATTEQSPAVVEAVRQKYWRPNLHVAASPALVSAGIDDVVDDVSPVQETILGTSIQGTAHTRGLITTRLVPDPNRAAFDIRLDGVTSSNNVGYNGPVTIFSRGCSQVSGSKRVMFDMGGLTTLPACASVQTETTIDSICAKCKIIERIAWKKAGQSKGQAEAIGSQIAEGKLSRRMDEQSGEMLAKSNANFQDKVLATARRRDIYPRRAQFSTTAEQLLVELLHVTESQLAAPNAPPSAPTGNDLAVRMHESLVGNYSESILGGLKLTDEKLEQLVKEATGSVPEELRVTEDKDPWSITFSPDRPIGVRFQGDQLTLAVKVLKFQRGEEPEIKNNVRISGVYKFQLTPTGSKLTRQGDVDVVFVDATGTLPVRLIAMKSFLRRKFDAMLKPEFVSEGIELKGRWERAGKLVVRSMKMGDGWMTATWNLTPTTPAPPVAAR